MNKKFNSVASLGITNVTTMAVSKGVTFAGAILMFIGVGGMLLSNKSLTETEVKYLREHINLK